MNRVGIVTCYRYWLHGCPGFNCHNLCFDAILKKRGPLGNILGAEVVAYEPCTTCKKDGFLQKARDLLKAGIDYLVLPSCLYVIPPCPYTKDFLIVLNGEWPGRVVSGSFFPVSEERRGSPSGYLAKIDHKLFMDNLDLINPTCKNADL